jgi:hypothetical protein
VSDGTRDPAADEQQRHDRRYKVFAVVFAVVVLLFAAVSITVVVVAQ